MIQPALNYDTELKRRFRNTWFDPHYMYYHNSLWYTDFELDDSTWDKHQFAILNDQQELIGYVGYSIDRSTHSARDMGVISFGGSLITFAVDLLSIIKDMFIKFKFTKLTFSVVVGNPVEKHYDRLVNRIGGRVVGTFSSDTRLMDGELYDIKWYEVLREDYLNYLEKK